MRELVNLGLAVQDLAVFGRNRQLTTGDFLVMSSNLGQQAIDHFAQLLSAEICQGLRVDDHDK